MDEEWKKLISNPNTTIFTYGGMLFEKQLNGEITLEAFLSKKKIDVAVPEGVASIEKAAFKHSCVRSVKFPDSLKIIETQAFCGCEKLTDVQFGKGPVKIEGMAFENCSGIESLDLANVKKIGNGTFSLCENLQHVKLPQGLSEIGPSAFEDCDKLKEIRLPSSVSSLGIYSLGSVRDIYLEEPLLPWGITKSARKDRQSASLRIHLGEHMLIIPKNVGVRSRAETEEKLENSLKEDKKNLVLYRIGASDEDRQETALEGFRLEHDPELKPFLINALPEMLKRREAEEDFQSLFFEFRDNGMLTVDSIKEALLVAQGRGWPQTVAYLLREINEYERDSGIFSL